jgi:hypothetical protein
MKSELHKVSIAYNRITLDEMDSVKLLNRIDTKYVVNKNLIPFILSKISDYYRVLEINDKRIFLYNTLYYDTENDFMYLAHHNGKTNRTKIRYRKYVDSNLCFLEIKNKIKGNRTIKCRTKIENIETSISEFAKIFIEKNTSFQNILLEPKIFTNFSRITLVNNAMTERVTIDFDLKFGNNGSSRALENVAIIELKRDENARGSNLVEVLALMRAYPHGFSKYCIGRAILDENLKANNFKEIILTINKINNGKYFYRDFS